MALQRDFETLKEKNDGEKQPVCTNPLSVLKVVMKQCKNMQERMLSQLAAAESRHRKVGPRRRARAGARADARADRAHGTRCSPASCRFSQ